MDRANDIIIDGPNSDLIKFTHDVQKIRFSTYAAGSGAELARAILDHIQLTDINVWIAQGLIYAEVMKRIAGQISGTIKDAEIIYTSIIELLNKFYSKYTADFVVWEGEKILFSADMPPAKRKAFIEVLTIKNNEEWKYCMSFVIKCGYCTGTRSSLNI